jgi:hypothetical protein
VRGAYRGTSRGNEAPPGAPTANWEVGTHSRGSYRHSGLRDFEEGGTQGILKRGAPKGS